MLSWFNTKEVDAVADAVVAELRARFPPTGHEVKGKKDVQRVLKGVDRVMSRVDELARGGKLNVYKKARFGNRIQWALRESQYPAEFAEAMTHELVTQLTLAGHKARG